MTILTAAILALTQDAPIKKLEFLNGDWQSIESASNPDGTKTEFKLNGTNRWIFDGTCLRIEESFEIPGTGKFENLILMNYDSRDKVYRAWWFTNRGSKPLEFTGVFGEKEFVLTTVDRKPSPNLRITYKNIAKEKYDATLEVEREGKWTMQTVAEYKRVKK